MTSGHLLDEVSELVRIWEHEDVAEVRLVWTRRSAQVRRGMGE